MKFLIYFMLASCAVVSGDSSNKYVVKMPGEVRAKTFNVYWNVPTMQCASKKIPFDDLYEKFGIIQNKDDEFRGDKIAILYDPGRFPAIFRNKTDRKYIFRNGGVPQEGNLLDHLQVFRDHVMELIPDKNFIGIAIIDFEEWKPIFRQNFGSQIIHTNESCNIEQKLHPDWGNDWVQAEAKWRFESSARKFMQSTISVAKEMRPNATWGYYGFPYCFNMANDNPVEACSSTVVQENDQSYWLWSESTGLYPSIYTSIDLSPSQLAAMVRGRVAEAARVNKGNSIILPYFWYRYRNGGFFTESDLAIILKELYESEASGFLIWGSSQDVDTPEKCLKFRKYFETVFGPAVASYTKNPRIQKYEVTDAPKKATTTENKLSTENHSRSTA